MRSHRVKVKSGVGSTHPRKRAGLAGTEASFESGEDLFSRGFFELQNPKQPRLGKGILPTSPTPALKLLHTPEGSGRLGWDFAGGRGRR